MTTQSLSSLVWEATQIERAIAENGGELTTELEVALEGVSLDTASKIDGYHFLTTKVLHNADWYDEQAKTYQKLAKTQRVFVERLKDRVKWAMGQMKLTEIQGHLVRYRLAKRDPKVVILDASVLPPNCLEQVTTVVPNKKLILAMLRDGITIPGAALEEVTALTPYLTRTSGDAKGT